VLGRLQITTPLVETLFVRLLQGNPEEIGLRPKQRLMQSQPTVSQNLHFAAKRGQVNIRPNIDKVRRRQRTVLRRRAAT